MSNLSAVARRSYLDYDSSLTDRETVMLVEEVVLLITFAITELKRLMFIGSITDSIKVRVCCWDKVILPTNIKARPCRWFNEPAPPLMEAVRLQGLQQ